MVTLYPVAFNKNIEDMANKPSYDGVSFTKPNGLSRTKVEIPQDKVTTKQKPNATPSPRGYA